MENVDSTDDYEKLCKENVKLKQQLEGYKKILKVFQGRSQSPGLELPSGRLDVGPAPISSESASCLLDSWLNTLDNFLTDLSQSDQEGLLHLPTSSTEVAHLRRGLVQARGAIQTLSDTCLAGQDKLSEGRLSSEGRVSPDSGCSDNPSSAPNTLRESLQNSHISSSNSELCRERNRCGSDIDLSYNDRDAGVDLSDFQAMDSVRKGNFSHGLTRDSTMIHDLTQDGAMTRHSTMIHDLTQDGAMTPDAGSRPHRLPSRFDNTFTPSFLFGNETFGDALGDITGRPSLFKLDNTMTLDTTHNESSKAELRERMKSLEDVIRACQEKSTKNPSTYMDSLQELLNELHQLRKLLEDSIAHNEHLEKLLFELNTSSENTVQDLKFQLHQSYTIIQNKVQIISEKDKLVRETSENLAKYRDNSAKDSAQLEFCQDRVKSLEKELQDGKSTNSQLTTMCQQLKTAVEQYKKRCDQLEGDNKSHMDAVYRYKNKVKDLEEEMTKKTEDETTIDELKTHINILETEAQHWKENESKYKDVLSESKSQISRLSSDLDKVRNELTLQQHDLVYLKGELEQSRDTVEKQNQHLCDKNCIIDDINAELKEKNHILQEQNSLCQDLTSKMESLSTVNGKLSTQLEQQRLTCADYKRQIEKQNHLIKELKDGADHFIDRKAHENMLAEKMKELEEAGRLRDKYLYNLKLTYKEFSRMKKEFKESKRKCDETTVINDTLKTELRVREDLMDLKGSLLTDDAKQNMIVQLLQELSRARAQMNKLLVQNESIKKKMTELIEQMIKNKESDQATGGRCFGDIAMELNIKSTFSSETTEVNLGDDQTRPQDLIDGASRMDLLSSSLPLRESTPGGPCSKNQQHPRQSTGSLPCNLSESRDSRSEYFRSNKEETLGTFAPEISTSTLMTEDVSVNSSVSSGHFSVPGPIYKQQITDQCLLYNINDNPKHLAGLTQVKIDSDVRSLFAVGMIDHFEKLCKEAKECDIILKGLRTRVTERLKVFAQMSATEMIKSVEYSTLKELSYAADNMRLCVDSQLSMIGCFWTSELPAPNEKGEFVNQKLINQNATLRDEICSLRSKLGRDRGGPTNQLEEEELCRSLQSTLDVMTRARENLTSNISSSNSSFNNV